MSIVTSDFDTGVAAARRFLTDYPGPDRPTAIWAQNDIMATGLLKVFLSSGLQIPRDISLMGMDDIDLSRMVTPTLSTILQPFDAIANEAVRIILECSSTPDAGIQYVPLEPALVIRESTAPPSR